MKTLSNSIKDTIIGIEWDIDDIRKYANTNMMPNDIFLKFLDALNDYFYDDGELGYFMGVVSRLMIINNVPDFYEAFFQSVYQASSGVNSRHMPDMNVIRNDLVVNNNFSSIPTELLKKAILLEKGLDTISDWKLLWILRKHLKLPVDDIIRIIDMTIGDQDITKTNLCEFLRLLKFPNPTVMDTGDYMFGNINGNFPMIPYRMG